jgi:hypothetical protein
MNEFQLFLYLIQRIPTRSAVELSARSVLTEGSDRDNFVLIHPVMSPLWDIITGQRFMMTRVARWMLERVQGYLRGIVGSILH